MNFANVATSELFLLWGVVGLGQGASKSSGHLGPGATAGFSWVVAPTAAVGRSRFPPAPSFSICQPDLVGLWTGRVGRRLFALLLALVACCPAARGSCELCLCLEELKTTDHLSGWFFNSMLSKKQVWLVSFFLWHSYRDMARIMLTEAFKGKSCSSFSAAVGAFAICSGMQERSTPGRWALEGPSQRLPYLLHGHPLKGDGGEEGAGRQTCLSLLLSKG